MELRWPGGGRVNLTTETIIDLADAPLVPVPDFGIGLPLWVGFANPFRCIPVRLSVRVKGVCRVPQA